MKFIPVTFGLVLTHNHRAGAARHTKSPGIERVNNISFTFDIRIPEYIIFNNSYKNITLPVRLRHLKGAFASLREIIFFKGF